jgi:hypothetical protein
MRMRMCDAAAADHYFCASIDIVRFNTCTSSVRRKRLHLVTLKN